MENVLYELVVRHKVLHCCSSEILRSFYICRDSLRSGGKLLICGNGGSAADSEHIVGELMKSFMKRRPITEELKNKLIQDYPIEGHYFAEKLEGALPAISLNSQVALLSAICNDIAPEMVYAQQLLGYGQLNDTLIGISTSGNSSNVINAIKVANSLGLKTIGLTGKTGGVLNGLCTVTICVPEESTPLIQELHLPIYHALCTFLEGEFF